MFMQAQQQAQQTLLQQQEQLAWQQQLRDNQFEAELKVRKAAAAAGASFFVASALICLSTACLL